MTGLIEPTGVSAFLPYHPTMQKYLNTPFRIGKITHLYSIKICVFHIILFSSRYLEVKVQGIFFKMVIPEYYFALIDKLAWDVLPMEALMCPLHPPKGSNAS